MTPNEYQEHALRTAGSVLAEVGNMVIRFPEQMCNIDLPF